MSNAEKIGRNSSCPCGSGKKHKHCCLWATRVVVEREAPAIKDGRRRMSDTMQWLALIGGITALVHPFLPE